MKFLSGFMTLCVIFCCSDVFAGFGYDSPYEYDSVIAPVNIEGEGIYNLVISVQFMNQPYDKKIYKSDEYVSLLSRLSVMWSSVAINSVLQSEVSTFKDLYPLKKVIENEITKLADMYRKKYHVKGEPEVVFSISNFYLLDSKK